jgi:hypothetical protein
VHTTSDTATVADSMLAEAQRIIAVARERDVTLRLTGGLAVHALARDRGFSLRPYRDVDVVGLRRHAKRLAATFHEFGYEENAFVRLGSAGQVVQFYRDCTHGDPGTAVHTDDRVDVYLDAVRLDHTIPLADRLPADAGTVAPADLLLLKLQRTRPDPDDLRDAVALLKDLELDGGERPETIDAQRIACLCGRDWSLHHDVTRSLDAVLQALPGLGLGDGEAAKVAGAVADLGRAIAQHPKTTRWRLRSVAGERLPWSDAVDDRDGARIGVLEGVHSSRPG